MQLNHIYSFACTYCIEWTSLKFVVRYLIKPFSKQAHGFTWLQYKSFGNTVEKEEIACNEQFLHFPQCFLPIWRTIQPLHEIQNCCLSVWKSPNFVIWEGLKLERQALIVPADILQKICIRNRKFLLEICFSLVMKNERTGWISFKTKLSLHTEGSYTDGRLWLDDLCFTVWSSMPHNAKF